MITQIQNILKSVYCISIGDSMGTAIACDLGNEQYAILTCRHLIPETIYSGSEIDFYIKGSFDLKPFSGIMFMDDRGDDICAIIISANPILHAIDFSNLLDSISSYRVGNEVVIAGFPFLMNDPNMSLMPFSNGEEFFPQALFKHGYIAGVASVIKSGRQILLDLHNNKGFSGSPVFCRRIYPSTGKPTYSIVGLLSGFYYDKFDSGVNPASNSGIAYAYDIRFFLQQLDNFRRGRIQS